MFKEYFVEIDFLEKKFLLFICNRCSASLSTPITSASSSSWSTVSFLSLYFFSVCVYLIFMFHVSFLSVHFVSVCVYLLLTFLVYLCFSTLYDSSKLFSMWLFLYMRKFSSLCVSFLFSLYISFFSLCFCLSLLLTFNSFCSFFSCLLTVLLLYLFYFLHLFSQYAFLSI